MTDSIWPAPAKLNLFLHLIGRRRDGYHELQTVFQLLDYGDDIRLHARSDGRVRRRTELAGVSPSRDLVVKAAELLRSRTGTGGGVDIMVDKRLPIGGGLGGGSSDAAATLTGLNALWGLGLGIDELAELAVELGADVPVFVRGRSAWGEGVGERLTPVALDELWYVVVTPPCEVSTARVFAAPALTRNTAPLKIADFLEHGQPVGERKLSTRTLLERTGNDCESIVRELYREVDEVFRWLDGFAGPRLTGTGASVYAAFSSPAEADAVLARLPAKWTGFVARGINRSPLLDGSTAGVP